MAARHTCSNLQVNKTRCTSLIYLLTHSQTNAERILSENSFIQSYLTLLALRHVIRKWTSEVIYRSMRNATERKCCII